MANGDLTVENLVKASKKIDRMIRETKIKACIKPTHLLVKVKDYKKYKTTIERLFNAT